jgi:hypothetical protein
MFTASVFMTAKKLQLIIDGYNLCPSIDEWIKEMWYIK